MSARMRPGARTVLRVCLFTVHGASHLVPSSDRDDWRGMWDAELWHRVLQLDRHGRLSLLAGMALFHRCLGAYWHAAWVFGRSLAPRALLAGTLLAARELGATPAATAAAVLSLGLALGAGGTLLGVTQAARTRVTVTGQERVVRIWNRAPAAQIGRTALSPLELRTFRAESPSIEALAGLRPAVVTLGTGAEATTVDAGLVSAEFFETLGVAADIGRTLRPADFGDERAGAAPPVVLDAKLWHERLGGDRGIVGRTVMISGAPHRVVGVVTGPRIPRAGTRLWLPLGLLSESPGSHAVGAVARLRAGATPEIAERELNHLSRRLQSEWPGGYLGELGVVWSVVVEPLGGRGPRVSRLLALLAAGAVLTLIAGVAAAASVSAARFRARPGGARGLQALTTVAGGTAIGALLAAGTLRALGPWLDGWLPGARTAGAGGGALAFVGVGAAVALVAHLASMRARRRPAAETGRRRVPLTLLGCAAILAFGAGLSAWGYRALVSSGTGFRTDGLLAVALGRGGHQGAEGWRSLVARLPRVETVSRTLAAPLVQPLSGVTFVTEESSRGMDRTPMTADLQVAEPAYFGVIGLPIIAGRTFTSSSAPGGTADAPREVVVDASLAARFWPGASPLGRRIRVVLDPDRVTEWLTIVGVAADLYGTAPGEPRAPVLYLPLALDSAAATTLLVRTSLTPRELAGAIRRAGAGIVDPVDLGAAVAARGAPHLAATLILLVLAGLVALLAAAPRAVT
jgi:putative ABC transport system permease protein